MISEKSSKLINDFAVAVMNNSRTLSAEYIEQEEAAEKALVDYIADLEAENARTSALIRDRNLQPTNEKTPEDEDVVLVELENVEGLLVGCYCQDGWLFQNVGGGFGSGFPVVNTNVIRWWPLPMGGGG